MQHVKPAVPTSPSDSQGDQCEGRDGLRAVGVHVRFAAAPRRPSSPSVSLVEAGPCWHTKLRTMCACGNLVECDGPRRWGMSSGAAMPNCRHGRNNLPDSIRARVCDLEQPERDAISHFTLPWSAMEGRVLQTNANPNSLVEAAKVMARAGQVHLDAYQRSLAHFRERPFQDGAFTYHFEQLLFRVRQVEAKGRNRNAVVGRADSADVRRTFATC